MISLQSIFKNDENSYNLYIELLQSIFFRIGKVIDFKSEVKPLRVLFTSNLLQTGEVVFKNYLLCSNFKLCITHTRVFQTRV